MPVIKKILNVFSGADAKATPIDADFVELYDSTTPKEPKKVSWANIKATLKSYFDGLYPSGSGTSTGTNTGDQTLPTGEIDSFHKIVLPFDGANNSTTITDLVGNTWTARGDAKLSTSTKKTSLASLSLDGTGDYVDTPDSSAFTLGSKNFTAECWIKRAATGAAHWIFGQCNSAGQTVATSIALQINASDKIVGALASGLTWNEIIGATSVDTNWHHIIFQRVGSYLYLYLDGVLEGSVFVGSISANDSSNYFSVGRLGEYPNLTFNGNIDTFILSVGIARYNLIELAIPVKASGAEVITGTDDAKFVTAKAVIDSHIFTTNKIGSSNVIPTMTATTNPNGEATAQEYYSGYQPYKAFNGTITDANDCWASNGSALPLWLQYKFDFPQVITKYEVMARKTQTAQAPSAWTLYGSNDGVVWTQIDSRTSQTFTDTVLNTYYIYNVVPYLFYRFSFTAGGSGGYISIGYIKMYGESLGFLQPAFSTPNLIDDCDFERNQIEYGGTTYAWRWSRFGGTNSASIDGTVKHRGNYAGKFVDADSWGGFLYQQFSSNAVGKSFYISCWIRTSDYNDTSLMVGTSLSNVTDRYKYLNVKPCTTNNEWTYFQTVITGITDNTLYFLFDAASNGYVTHYIDDVQIREVTYSVSNPNYPSIFANNGIKIGLGGVEFPNGQIQNFADVLEVFKTANKVINNSATYEDDNHLFLPVEANTSYRFELLLFVVTDSTGKFKYQFTAPSGTVITNGQNFYGTTAAGSYSSGSFGTALTNCLSGNPQFNDAFVLAKGIITTSTTAGTLKIQWAQSTANASNCLVAAASYLRLKKIVTISA